MVFTCKDLKSSRETAVAYTARSSLLLVSRLNICPLCSGLAEGKVLTVLTFPRWHFWGLGSVCTDHPDSFLPLTYSSWQSVRQPQYRGRGAKLGWQGLHRGMTKGNRVSLAPPNTCAAGRKERYPLCLSSASAFLWFLFSQLNLCSAVWEEFRAAEGDCGAQTWSCPSPSPSLVGLWLPSPTPSSRTLSFGPAVR